MATAKAKGQHATVVERKEEAERSRSPPLPAQAARGVASGEAPPPAWAQMLLQGQAVAAATATRIETHGLTIGNRVEAVEANQAELARQLEAVTLRVAAMEEARTGHTGAASDVGSTCVSLGGMGPPSDIAPASGLSRAQPAVLVIGTFAPSTERAIIVEAIEALRSKFNTSRLWGRIDAPYKFGRVGHIQVGHLTEREIAQCLEEGDRLQKNHKLHTADGYSLWMGRERSQHTRARAVLLASAEKVLNRAAEVDGISEPRWVASKCGRSGKISLKGGEVGDNAKVAARYCADTHKIEYSEEFLSKLGVTLRQIDKFSEELARDKWSL